MESTPSPNDDAAGRLGIRIDPQLKRSYAEVVAVDGISITEDLLRYIRRRVRKSSRIVKVSDAG